MKKSHKTYSVLSKIENELSQLKGEKLILWGGQDFCFNDHFYKRWTDIYPEAQRKYYKDAGHYVLEDESNASSFIQGFLND